MAEIGDIKRVPPVEKVLGIPKDRRHRPPHIPEEKPTPKPQDNSGGQIPVEPQIGEIIDKIA